MDDLDLDDLLLRARPRSTSRADQLAVDVALAARHRSGPIRRRWSRRRIGLVLGGAVAGLALTAGGTLTAYQLRVPPFQTLGTGLVRIRPGIAADYTNIAGEPWNCDAFLEFADVTPAEVKQITAHVQAQNWSDLGPSAYREAQRTSASRTVNALNGRYDEVVGDRLREEAEQALPGSVTDHPALNHDKYSGSSLPCQPGRR